MVVLDIDVGPVFREGGGAGVAVARGGVGGARVSWEAAVAQVGEDLVDGVLGLGGISRHGVEDVA